MHFDYHGVDRSELFSPCLFKFLTFHKRQKKYSIPGTSKFYQEALAGSKLCVFSSWICTNHAGIFRKMDVMCEVI